VFAELDKAKEAKMVRVWLSLIIPPILLGVIGMIVATYFSIETHGDKEAIGEGITRSLPYIIMVNHTFASINKKIKRIIPGKTTREQVIEVFGKPNKYLWGEETFSEEDLPNRYVMIYGDVGIDFFVGKYTVSEGCHFFPR